MSLLGLDGTGDLRFRWPTGSTDSLCPQLAAVGQGHCPGEHRLEFDGAGLADRVDTEVHRLPRG